MKLVLLVSRHEWDELQERLDIMAATIADLNTAITNLQNEESSLETRVAALEAGSTPPADLQPQVDAINAVGTKLAALAMPPTPTA